MVLIQSPIIEHSLIELGNRVSQRLKELNLSNQVATEETIKTLKVLRAELNKESKDFEEKRKAIKDAVLNPYNDFETIYKEQISEKYKQADTTLKEKINDFEIKVKQDKREKIIAYFEELRDFEQLDWLSFEQLKIDINLSTSEKKYKEQVLAFVQQVRDDLDLIASDTYSAEILVEYKSTLNASAAIKTIRDRKQKEKEETERLLFDRTMKRKSSLRSLNFITNDLTRTFNWITDESVMISAADVEHLSEEDWQKKYLDLEARTKAKEADKPQIIQAPKISTPTPQQPKKEVKEEIFEAKFLVKGTYTQLKALGSFLKENNYEYQNID